MPAKNAAAYWKANNRLIALLLIIWAVASLGAGVLFVEPLNTIKIGSVPLGFWMAQQGSIYIFVILIFVYAFAMDILDKRHLPAALKENQPSPPAASKAIQSAPSAASPPSASSPAASSTLSSSPSTSTNAAPSAGDRKAAR